MALKSLETEQINDDRDRLFITSVERAFLVLECIAGAKEELGLSDIARYTGITRSAAQRATHTLCKLGYLIQNQHSKTYRISNKMLSLTHSLSENDRLKKCAYPVLERAHKECQETINLTYLENHEVVYVLRFPSKHVVSVDLTLGQKLPIYCTAPGRVFLAGMPEEERIRALEGMPRSKFTSHTTTDISDLLEIVKKVEQDGYSISNQEMYIGDISTAAPVFDPKGEVIGAVNIAVPYPRWTIDQVKKQLTPIAVACGQEITSLFESY